MNSKLFDELATIKDTSKATQFLYSRLSDTCDRILVGDAIEFSTEAHKGQYRKSGEDYIVHPLLVASIVASIGGDDDMIVASLLHDVVEDTGYSIDFIAKNYGSSISHLVDGLTKITEIKQEHKTTSKKDDEKLIASALSFRKMLIASIIDIRVLVIKLCDRVHNMLTLDALSLQKQKKIAQESLVVFAPIAHRLGISILKNILEDRSFYYILPKNYQIIDTYLEKNRDTLTLLLNEFIDSLKKHLLSNGLQDDDFEIKSRIKHYYSIYLKTQRKGVNIDEVLDLLAIRIILKDANSCYKTLGVIHQNYRPIMARFKDYIAIPKENGYQTIHTTVFAKTDIYEIQIRTQQMDENAEYGLASHSKYKGDTEDSVSAKWLKSLEYNSKDITEFYELAKNDLYSDDIIVISPKGDNYTLPREAIALDFAFMVHSDVGKRATHAYVNGEKKSLLSILKNGDSVKIATNKEIILRCSWIDTVKTSRAKEQIKQCCKSKIKEINIKSNINILSNLFSDDKSLVKELLESDEELQTQLSSDINSFESFKELKGKVKQHLIAKSNFLGRLKLSMTTLKQKELDNFYLYSNSSISSVSFDYCCHPKIGDEIVSFKKDKKTVIHHKLCHVASKLIDENTEMVFVEWKKHKRAKYSLIISLENKKGALAEYLNYLSKYDINLNMLQVGNSSDEFTSYTQIQIDTDIIDINKIKSIISKKAKLIELYETKDAYKGG